MFITTTSKIQSDPPVIIFLKRTKPNKTIQFLNGNGLLYNILIMVSSALATVYKIRNTCSRRPATIHQNREKKKH